MEEVCDDAEQAEAARKDDELIFAVELVVEILLVFLCMILVLELLQKQGVILEAMIT